jgi:hypothetical protein
MSHEPNNKGFRFASLASVHCHSTAKITMMITKALIAKKRLSFASDHHHDGILFRHTWYRRERGEDVKILPLSTNFYVAPTARQNFNAVSVSDRRDATRPISPCRLSVAGRCLLFVPHYPRTTMRLPHDALISYLCNVLFIDSKQIS